MTKAAETQAFWGVPVGFWFAVNVHFSNSMYCTLVGLVIFFGSCFGNSFADEQQVADLPRFPSTANSSPVFQEFQRERYALAVEREDLLKTGASFQQVVDWEKRNASRLSARRDQMQILAAESALEPREFSPTSIPAGVSDSLKTLIGARAALADARAKIHNQLLETLPQEVTKEQVQQMQEKEQYLFRQRYKKEIQAMRQTIKALAGEQGRKQASVPSVLDLPQDISLETRKNLETRNQMASERAKLWNQLLDAPPATREWVEQSTGHFKQM